MPDCAKLNIEVALLNRAVLCQPFRQGEADIASGADDGSCFSFPLCRKVGLSLGPARAGNGVQRPCLRRRGLGLHPLCSVGKGEVRVECDFTVYWIIQPRQQLVQREITFRRASIQEVFHVARREGKRQGGTFAQRLQKRVYGHPVAFPGGF